MKNLASKNEEAVVSLEELFEVGAHYGYSKTKRHPSVSEYIYTTKNKVDIINLEKTSSLLTQAMKFVEELGSQNKKLLLVGTKPEAQEIIKETAEILDLPYVAERWIGGTLSNFTEIKKRITELENYKKENKEGSLTRFTKKERSVLAKKMEKLNRYYSGLLDLKKIPDALLIVDSKEEKNAKAEAQKINIPVITITNSDSDITGIDFPIIANDTGIPSIKFFIQKIAQAYQKGKKMASSVEKTL